MNVLLILDGSLSNPILQSQGIPHIIENSGKRISYFVLSFEIEKAGFSGTDKWFIEAENLLKDKAKLFSVKMKNGFFFGKLKIAVFFFLGILKAYQIVKANNIDVIHGRSNRPTLIGIILKPFLNKKVLFDSRGIVSDEMDNAGIVRRKLEQLIEKILVKYSDAMVVVSQNFKKHIIDKFGPNEINSDKIFVVRNSFSEKRFSYSNAMRIKQRDALSLVEKFVMVYSGPSVGWQRFDLIIKIFKKLKRLKRNAFLLVISYDPKTAQVLGESGVSSDDYSIFNVPATKVNEHIIVGDFGIILSDHKLRRIVSAPIKFGEYLASGLPVLLMKNIGDTEEIIRNHGVGVFLDDKEESIDEALTKMIELVGVPGIREKCRATVEKELSLTRSADQYLQIYNVLTKQSK